jgi:hypothetical protein
MPGCDNLELAIEICLKHQREIVGPEASVDILQRFPTTQRA